MWGGLCMCSGYVLKDKTLPSEEATPEKGARSFS
jgi:hypothetical protein